MGNFNYTKNFYFYTVMVVGSFNGKNGRLGYYVVERKKSVAIIPLFS